MNESKTNREKYQRYGATFGNHSCLVLVPCKIKKWHDTCTDATLPLENRKFTANCIELVICGSKCKFTCIQPFREIEGTSSGVFCADQGVHL